MSKNKTYTFEIFLLDNKTLCHYKEIGISHRTYSYDEYHITKVLKQDYITMTKQLIKELHLYNEIIEVNIWGKKEQKYVEEIIINC